MALGLSPCAAIPQVDFQLSLASAGKSPGRRQGIVEPVSPSALRRFVPEDAWGSPKFPANPSDLCRALGPRSVPCARSGAALGCCPRRLLPQGHQTILTFVARSHGLSHGCLRFVPPSQATTQDSLPVADQPFRVGLFIPQSSVGEFHTFALPSPRASLGAKQFRLLVPGSPRRFMIRFLAVGQGGDPALRPITTELHA